MAYIPINTTPTSTSQLPFFEGPTNIADNYGARYRGYICAPATGNYTFWIASDDYSELWLSTDANPDNKVKIAYVNGWTYPRVYDKYSSHQSAPIQLIAGRSYYIEALHKEGGGGDNLSVGWKLPNGTLERPIPGMRLSPYTGNANFAKVSSDEVSLVNGVEGIDLTLLPNPTGKGIATLIIEGQAISEQEVMIEILNLQGFLLYKDRTFMDGRIMNLPIIIGEQFNTGMYIVRILINGQVYYTRMMVE